MSCKAISDANPDIAGIGVILAFGLQALISLLLSAAARLLLSKTFPLIISDRKRFWKELLAKGSLQSATVTDEEPLTLENFFRFIFGVQTSEFWTKLRHEALTGDSHPTTALKARKALTAVKELMNDERFPVDEIVRSFRKEDTAETDIMRLVSNIHEEDGKGDVKEQELIGRVLLVASDAQTVTGIALIITAMAQQGSLSLYHLHIIYDTINFTSVSNFAAICCSYDYRVEIGRVRYISIGVFGLLYTGFTIMFGIRLNDWNDQLPGRCYSTSGISSSKAKHPLVDQIYLGMTSFYVLGIAQAAMIYCRVTSRRQYWQMYIIFFGALQFVLHVYTLVALRVSNQPLLDNSLEDQWGFAQILALVMLGSTLLECARSLEEYFRWQKKKAVRPRREVEIEDKQETLMRSNTFP